MAQVLSSDPNWGRSDPAGEESRFRTWYARTAKAQDLNPDPDAPEQLYDYRSAFRAGATPDRSGHWPSQFKKPGHPNEIVGGFNTRTGERVSGTPQAGESELVRLGWEPETAKRLSGSSGDVLSDDPNWGASEQPDFRVDVVGQMPRESGPMRFARGAVESLNPLPIIEGLYQTARHPVATVQGMRAAKVAEDERTRQIFDGGTTTEQIGQQAREDFQTSDPWRTAGSLTGAFVVPGAALKGGKAALSARRASTAAKLPAKAANDLLTAIPSTKTAPYMLDDWDKAKPYLNAEHGKAPITSTVALRDALDASIGSVEQSMSSYVEAFPAARVQPRVTAAVQSALKDHPRGEFLPSALKELDDLGLDQPLTLGQADAIRRQLNAENKAILRRNNYDQYTARQADPGFAAREVAAKTIRDSLYDYLEQRGVSGVRELRREEGSLIKLRNAAERQVFSGQRPAPGSSDPSLLRKAGANVVKNASTAVGATIGGPSGAVAGATVGEELASVIRGGRKTRDDLVARIFSYPDDRLPTLPTVPAQPLVRGLLTEGARPMPAPETSYVRSIPAEMPKPQPTTGTLKATIGERVQTRAKSDDVPDFGLPDAVDPAVERTFFLRWLADDLREMPFQKGGSTKRQRAETMETWRPGDPEHLRSGYIPSGHVAGTPTYDMLRALGFKGSRADMASRLDGIVSGKIKNPKADALSDAFREAWDGQRFDWQLVSDQTISRLGIRRQELKSPITLPNMDDQPSMADRIVGRKN